MEMEQAPRGAPDASTREDAKREDGVFGRCADEHNNSTDAGGEALTVRWNPLPTATDWPERQSDDSRYHPERGARGESVSIRLRGRDGSGET